MRVLLMADPRGAGYATLSGVHKYFSELVNAMPAEKVHYVFVSGAGSDKEARGDAAPLLSKHEGTKTRRGREKTEDGRRKTEDLLVDSVDLPPPAFAKGYGGTRRGLGVWLPLSARLILGYVKDVWRLARVLRPFRDQVDLFHVVAGGCEITPIAAKLAGLRHVVDTVQAMHGEDAGADHWVRRLVERLCFWCGNYHIFVSDATREDWENRLGRNFPKSCTIYNGMKAPDFSGFDRSAYRRQFVEDEENAFIVGICARLHHMKGHRVLIEAFAEMVEPRRHEDTKLRHCGIGEGNHEGTKTQGGGEKTEDGRLKTEDQVGAERGQNLQPYLLIAGEGQEREAIERQIVGLPDYVQERIKLVGHREDPCLFVASLDLHVMASTSIETIGYANIEAMFAGVPCIVSDVGGAKEIVRGSGGGVVVKAGNVDELRKAMLLYVNDKERSKEDGEKGRAYARRTLSAVVMTQQVLDIYRRVTGETPSCNH